MTELSMHSKRPLSIRMPSSLNLLATAQLKFISEFDNHIVSLSKKKEKTLYGLKMGAFKDLS
jgi:hypothetical protein